MSSSVLPSRTDADLRGSAVLLARRVLGRIREQSSLWKPETSGSGGPIVTLFRAQPEHAICQSYPAGTAKNYQNSGDSKRPANVRMTIDKESRNPKTDSQHHAQGAIHSPYIQKRRHIGSGVRRFIQNRRSVQLAWPKMGQINFPRKQQITPISSLHLSDRSECSGITNHVTLTETCP